MRAQDLRTLIDQASEQTVIVQTAELDLGGRRVPVTLVTPDLLTLQEVVDEVRAEAAGADGSADVEGRYMLKLIPRIAYAEFDTERMDGELVFPHGESDPVYRRLTRHPTAFPALSVAAAEVVRPLQSQAGRNADSGPATNR